MPRFVLLEHDHPHLHWDFMLAAGGVLRTWRLDAPPAPGHLGTATRLSDHRLAYLDYEGPVSGGRGTVRRWERGTFDWLVDDPDRVAVRLEGERLRGVARLERWSGDEWAWAFEGESGLADKGLLVGGGC
jgi:hypothetical protein